MRNALCLVYESLRYFSHERLILELILFSAWRGRRRCCWSFLEKRDCGWERGGCFCVVTGKVPEKGHSRFGMTEMKCG